MTIQDKLNELKEKDRELMCWFENIVRMQQDWNAVLTTFTKLLVLKCSESTLEDVENLQTDLYQEWKEQETLFLAEISKNIPLTNVSVQGYKEFDLLKFVIDYRLYDILISYKPVDVAVSFWNTKLSNVTLL